MKTNTNINVDTTTENARHGARRTVVRNCGRTLLKSLLGAAVILQWIGEAAMAAGGGSPVLPVQVPSSVAVPPEGNPYGLAVVPPGFPNGGVITLGDLLVSNFNNSAGQQGLGTTIDFIDPDTGQTALFFQVSGAETTGLTNALGVLKAGFVLAGTVLTTDGHDDTAAPGDLYVLDKNGKLVDTIAPKTNLINGPWGMAINDQGSSAQIFVSNVFDGTVTRLDVSLKGGSFTINKSTTIASGYKFTLDPAAIVIGPAGLVFDKKKDILYVAAEDDNAIFAIADASTLPTSAGTGTLVFSNTPQTSFLNGPLGLTMAANGDLITVNDDSVNQPTPPPLPPPSDIVEFTPTGNFVRQFEIDPNPGNGFAVLVVPTAKEFAYVDDLLNNVTIWRLP